MVHSLLQPVFPVTFAAVSCALTCAWTASATGSNAPLARANDPPEPFTVVVRTIPITRPANLPFEERWQVQADQPVTQARTEQPALVTTNCIPSRSAQRRDPVCGSKGRRYFHIGRILSWRCRR